MIALGIPTQFINITKSFLSNRIFAIKINNTLSSSKNIQAGVPRESFLSPHIFALYVNDFPRHPDSKIALFADDTFLYSIEWINHSAIKKLQLQINKIKLWFSTLTSENLSKSFLFKNIFPPYQATIQTKSHRYPSITLQKSPNAVTYPATNCTTVH